MRINDHPSPQTLRGGCVGRPVSAMGTFHHGGSLGFLLSGVPEKVASYSFPDDGFAPATAVVAYQRSPGVQVLCAEFEPAPIVGGVTLYTITATLSGGGVLLNDGHASPLMSGGTTVQLDPAYSRRRSPVRGFFDVSALPTNAIKELTFVTGGGVILKRMRVTLAEVPMTQTDPIGAPTTEIGVNPGWTIAGNNLYAGTASTSAGFNRILDQLDMARTQVRRHIQFGCLDTVNVAGALYQTASAVLVNMLPGGGKYRIRARRLRASPTPNLYNASFRYLAAAGGTVRFVVQPVGQAAVNWDFVLPIAAAFTRSATFAFQVPTNGTNQEVDITPKFLTANVANPLTVSNCAAIEAEI